MKPPPGALIKAVLLRLPALYSKVVLQVVNPLAPPCAVLQGSSATTSKYNTTGQYSLDPCAQVGTWR